MGKYAASIMVLMTLAGCQWWQPLRDTPRIGVPADFALEFIVEGDIGATEMADRSAIYILGANRQLRVAVGPMTRAGVYPRVVRRLSHEQAMRIMALVDQRGLIAEPSSPAGELALRGRLNPRVLYHVDLTAAGRINRYVTTPEESPPTVALLALLIEASGMEAQ